MPYLKKDDLNTYYEDIGAGDPILFLHSSFSRGIISFSSQIYQFEYHYRCLLPDFRGHGRTESNYPKWSSEQIAEDMIGFLDGLGLKKIHLVGYSMGGTVALYMASKYPERVKSVTTIGTLLQVTNKILEEADELEPKSLIQSDDNKEFIEVLIADHMQVYHGDWKVFVKQTVEDWRKHPNISEENLEKITAPCLFIFGEKDPAVTDYDLEYIKSHICNAEVRVVKNCNHRAHMVGNDPEKVNNMILNFLRNIDKKLGME